MVAGLLAIALFLLPATLGTDWIKTFTAVAIYSVVAAGLVVLYGRVGMISLGQIALLAIGTWTATRLSFGTNIPFPLLILITGSITCVIGVLIGLPALRLSGLYLALITLMGAGAVSVVLSTINFPNGGGGFTGRTNSPNLSGLAPVSRPAGAGGDIAYYRYVVIVCVLMFLLALVHFATKPGRAWAAIRESEPGALAAGVNITLYKLWAFALASFMTGVAGCLLAADVGVPTVYGFPTQDSLTLIATALIGGIFTLWGALDRGDLPAARALRLPGRVGAQSELPADHLRRRPAAGAAHRPGRSRRSGAEGPGEALGADHPASPEAPGRVGGIRVIEVQGLTVRFAGVTPIDDMSVTFREGACGLIGPNGAGKTTFFNVLSGFVKPAAGSIRVFGDDLLKMVDFRRARWGLRRTFQTEQAIEQLSVFDNVAMIHEHSGQGRAARREAVLTAIDFVGLEAPPSAKVGGLGARERRLVEIARAVVGQPRIVLLDEPAAGLPDQETEHLGEVIQQIPGQFGALVILVDHDMTLVSACCETTAVLDFGKLIASGPTAEVLRNEHVIRAYLGTEEEL